MKLEDVIMVSENREGKEINFLLNLADYMQTALSLWGDHAEDMAGAIGTLYETKKGKTDWSDLYVAEDRSIRAAFCTGEAQLRGFLMGHFNEGVWSFNEGRCSRDCFDVLRMYNMKTDGYLRFPYLHHERVEHDFHAGEVLHNMNGNDYYVLAALSPHNLLLMSLVDGQIIAGKGVRFYERYPEGERPDDDSIVTGVEWDHGIYFGTDITGIDFDILKQEYGTPARVENLSDLRDKIRKDFWMHRNVEQKEGLAMRVRKAAKDNLEEVFGTDDPEVFQVMLDRGVYDRMRHAKEDQKNLSGQSR